MNLEHMYALLFGASGGQGAKFTVVHRWLTACGVIDGRIVTDDMFVKAFERLAPNREELSLTQFIQFLGILSRETRQDVNIFLERFRAVEQDIVQEIQSHHTESTEYT